MLLYFYERWRVSCLWISGEDDWILGPRGVVGWRDLSLTWKTALYIPVGVVCVWSADVRLLNNAVSLLIVLHSKGCSCGITERENPRMIIPVDVFFLISVQIRLCVSKLLIVSCQTFNPSIALSNPHTIIVVWWAFQRNVSPEIALLYQCNFQKLS